MAERIEDVLQRARNFTKTAQPKFIHEQVAGFTPSEVRAAREYLEPYYASPGIRGTAYGQLHEAHNAIRGLELLQESSRGPNRIALIHQAIKSPGERGKWLTRAIRGVTAEDIETDWPNLGPAYGQDRWCEEFKSR